MATKREFAHSVPSVMATLMGLDEIPTQRPFQKKPRVLSQNYLHTVSSIGVRKKFSNQQSLKFGAEHMHVLQVLETLRTKKHPSVNTNVLQSGCLSMSKSTCTFSVGECNTHSRTDISSVSNSRSVAIKHNLGKKNEILFSPNRSVGPEKKERKRFSNGVESVGPRFRKERAKIPGKSTSSKSAVETELTMPSSTFCDRNNISMLNREPKAERGKTIKRSDSRSRSVLTFFNLVESQGIFESVGCMSDSESVNLKGFKEDGLFYAKSPSYFESNKCMISEKGHSSLQEQEMSNETFDEEESVSSQYSESLNSFEEAYQPSPISVLDRLGKNKTISDCFKSVSSSLHELHLQLELLKSRTSESYSEGSSMVVSSDNDSEQESVYDPENNQGLLSPFRIEESRDFLYMVDVLTEAGLRSGKRHNNHYKISNSIFETMEKKYGEQISWKRSERRLLFDRVNFCLAEILQPFTLTKSAVKRLCFSIDELWVSLASQEEDLRKESEKILGKDDRWMELGDEIRVIGGEIEDNLFHQLVADVSVDCF